MLLGDIFGARCSAILAANFKKQQTQERSGDLFLSSLIPLTWQRASVASPLHPWIWNPMIRKHLHVRKTSGQLFTTPTLTSVGLTKRNCLGRSTLLSYPGCRSYTCWAFWIERASESECMCIQHWYVYALITQQRQGEFPKRIVTLKRFLRVSTQLYGLEDDLEISDNQYLLSLTVSISQYSFTFLYEPVAPQIFFFSYSIFEVPSNVFLKRLRPSIWLSGLMLFWGVMMVCIK